MHEESESSKTRADLQVVKFLGKSYESESKNKKFADSLGNLKRDLDLKDKHL